MSKPRVSGRVWLHAWQMTAIGFGALFVAGLATRTAQLAVLAPVVAVAAAAVCLSVLASTQSLGMTTVACVGSLFAVGWLIFVHLVSVWSQVAVVSIIVAALVMTPLLAMALARHRQMIADEHAANDAARQAAELRKWTELLEGVNVSGPVCIRVVKTRAGHAVTYRLPRDGSRTVQNLIDATQKLEIALELKRGTVRFTHGKHAGEAVMHVEEADVFAETIPYPRDLSALTINEPFDIGVSADGTLALIFFRELRLLIIGETGAGKTNLLNVIIAQLSRCVDVIIFGIDLTGGGVLAPWVKPWIDHKCNRPVIDWPATDRAEAERMLSGLVRLIHARKPAYALRGKVTPTCDEPVYVLVCDEVSELFTQNETKDYREKYHEGEPTPRSLGWLGTRVNNTGRGAMVDAIWAAQRSTTSHIPSDIKSQCGLRIGLGTTTVGEASNLVPDSAAAQKIMALIRSVGTGIIWRKNRSAVEAVKFYHLEDPAEIERVAVHTGNKIRPEPPEFDLFALGTDYRDRWERLAPLLGQWSDMGSPGGGTFEQIVAQVADPEAGLNDWQRRAIEIIGQQTLAVGIRSGILAKQLNREGYTIDRSTVSRWLPTQPMLESVVHGMWRMRRDAKGQTG